MLKTLLVAGAMAALGFGSLAVATDVLVVSQHNRQFSPQVLEITKGETVRIVNDDRVTHHVYVAAPEMSYDSGEMPVGTSLTLRFDRTGTFPVRCAIHPKMRLDVTVR